MRSSLIGGQQDYMENAANDSAYIGGTGTCGNLYQQQLAAYNAPLMRGGGKGRRSSGKGGSRRSRGRRGSKGGSKGGRGKTRRVRRSSE